MVHKVWHTTAAIMWLQNLLQERFGHAFLLQPQADRNQIAIYLTGDPRCITLALDGATFIRADSNLPCSRWNAGAEAWHTALPGELPAPGVAQLPAPLIVSTPNGVHISYDILGFSYWMLTRQEEVGRSDLDKHGRFSAFGSHAFKHEYLERPIVDEWFYVLGQAISKTWQGITLKHHTFCTKVSHDVDAPWLYAFKPWKNVMRIIAHCALKNGDFRSLYTAPWVKIASREKISGADPYNTFEWIMDLSEQYGLTSAFYFICGRSSEMDADYEIENPIIRDLMRRIHERGHEIGLHPSYGTYQNPGLIRKEADRLRLAIKEEKIEQYAIGGRMHYLRWEQPITLQALNDAGLAYDTTLGYAEHPGFRCGTCYEYAGFNTVTQKTLKIRVRPLIVMECTIIDNVYQGLGVTEKALNKFLEIKKKCKKVDGCFTMLWHNSWFGADRKLKTMYKNIIEF